MQLFKADLLCRLIGMAQCIGQARAGSGDTQHTAAGRDKGAVLGDGSAGVVDRHILLAGQLAVHKTGDGLTLLVSHRVAAGSQNDAGGSAVRELDLLVFQRAVGAGLHHGQQVAFQQGQYYLGFGVAKAAVVFNHLGAVRGQHQAKVQAALKGATLCLHGGNRRQENLLHALGGNGGGVAGVGGNGAHAAGV